MTKIADLTVDVKLNLELEQAERALKIVEWFINDNPQYKICETTRKRIDMESTVLSFMVK